MRLRGLVLAAVFVACDREESSLETDDVEIPETWEPVACGVGGGSGMEQRVGEATDRCLRGERFATFVGWDIDVLEGRIATGGGLMAFDTPPEAYVAAVPSEPTGMAHAAVLTVTAPGTRSDLGRSVTLLPDEDTVLIGEIHDDKAAMLYSISAFDGYDQPLAILPPYPHGISGDATASDVHERAGTELIIGTVSTDAHGAVVIYPGTVRGYVSPVAAIARIDGVDPDADGRGGSIGEAIDADGDLDGDGLSDLILGARNYPLFQAGAVYAMCGPMDGDVTVDDACMTLYGEGPIDNLGFSVAFGGDLDGDGYDDLLVGSRPYAPNVDPSQNARGHGYIVSGTRRGTYDIGDVAQAIFEGPRDYGLAGEEVAGRFDFDGDGTLDVAFGAPGLGGDADDPSEVHDQPGRLYVFRGPHRGQLAAVDALQLVGADVGDLAGHAIEAMPDRDGDGRDELVVGAPYDDQGAESGGMIYVVYGFWPDRP